MQSIETEGHSIDDAIERALQQLGVSRDRVDIEIVSNATRGLFGLGGRRARVRATLRRPLTIEPHTATPDTRPQPMTSPERRAQPPRPTSTPPPTSTPRPPAASPRPAAPPRAARPPAPAARPQEATRVTADRPPAEPPLDPAVLERARTVLAEIVRLTGSEGVVEVAQQADGGFLVITGDPSGVLIGRRGQTLDALEYVINRVVAHGDESVSRVAVDAENYRERRRQTLEQLARRAADRTRRRGKPLALSPMNPRDRRIVHLALRNDPTLTTRSAGTGFYRKVIIAPAGGARGNRSRQSEST
jgi:spoIIIJ-associated protein